MITFNPSFLEQTAFLSEEQNDILFTKLEDIDIDELFGEIGNDKSIIYKLCFDFIYTSAVIEGNTYTRGEAEILFETKKPISSKSIDDANMLLNIKTALEYTMQERPKITKHSIRELHQILSQSLLPKKAQGGVREISVTIGNSDYIPINNPQELEMQMDNLLKHYEKIKNPFNRAIYIHNNIAYLQYFQDCNKRLARALQGLSLINDNMPFLSYNAAKAQTEIKAYYKDALLAYYEKGNAKMYADFFFEEYYKTLDLLQTMNQKVSYSKKI